MRQTALIYLMGAGRSGTTLIATILGESKNIIAIGEMHQFLEHYLDNKKCSCDKYLNNCNFWSPIIFEIEKLYTKEELLKINNYNINIETHSNIIKSYFKKNDIYLTFQENLFEIINKQSKSLYYLDSAKYISRALQLNKSKFISLKIIYVIRDVRGVINSFNKKVQTTKSPISTILYYSFINYFAQIVSWLLGKKKVLKVKYEDFIENPIKALNRIEQFLNTDLSEIKSKINNNESFNIPHIIGGNRLKSNTKIVLKKDFIWKQTFSRTKQLVYFILTLPIMLINRYKA